jgi:hypothetical protein
VIPVYDAGNHQRLLGHAKRRQDPAGPTVFTFPMRPASVTAMYAPAMEDVEAGTVEMECFTRYTEDGWKAEVAYRTVAPLADLMRVADFRLPGETESKYLDRIWLA